METETKTERPHEPLTLVLDGAPIVVPRFKVHEFVQAAYDQHGILATPALEAEASRVIDPWCPCGRPGCSDAVVTR